MKDKISKKSVIFTAMMLMLCIVAIAFAAVDGNYQIIVRGLGLSDSNPLPVNKAKGTNIVLGSYSSTHQSNVNPAIDMSKASGGAILVKVNSGTGKWYVNLQSSNSTTGTFGNAYIQTAGTVAAFPLLSTSTNRSFHIDGMKDAAIKINPVLASGSSNATVTFTPSN